MRDETPEISGTITINSAADVRKACDDILRVLSLFNYEDRDRFAIRLAVEESATNAIVHGNSGNPEKSVSVEYVVYQDRVAVTITDEGDGFNHNRVEDCTRPNNIMRSGGRGVWLVRRFMDEVSYNEKGNSVRMVRLRHGDSSRENSG